MFAVQCCVATSDNPWSTVRPGVEVLRGDFQDLGNRVKFVLIRCDPAKVSVKIIDTFHELGNGSKLGTFSLREVVKAGALFAANAGATASYSIPIPVGLLMTRGKIVSKPNLRAQSHSGFLCIAKDRIEIADLAQFKAPGCEYAVQRGPLLSIGSALSPEGQPYRRTIIATDNKRRLLILVTADKATLRGVSRFLFASQQLGVRSAMNMDGDVSSGLLATPSLESAIGETGDVNALLGQCLSRGAF